MKKPVLISIFILVVLAGVAYIAINKTITKRKKEEIIRVQEQLHRQEEIEKAHEQKEEQAMEETEMTLHQENEEQKEEAKKRKEEVKIARKQLEECKKALADAEVKVAAAKENYDEVNDFEFFRTKKEKKEDLAKEVVKIKKVEKSRDSMKAKITHWERVMHHNE